MFRYILSLTTGGSLKKALKLRFKHLIWKTDIVLMTDMWNLFFRPSHPPILFVLFYTRILIRKFIRRATVVTTLTSNNTLGYFELIMHEVHRILLYSVYGLVFFADGVDYLRFYIAPSRTHRALVKIWWKVLIFQYFT